MTSHRTRALAAALFVVLVAGCSGGTDGSSSPTSSAGPQLIHSTLIDMALPPGTTISSHADGLEIWQSPGSQDQAVAALKPQLPIGGDLDGLRWCGQRTDASGGVAWSWGGPGGSIVVDAQPGGEIRIERSAKPAVGCG
jgi:uncharacterized lipoprotein